MPRRFTQDVEDSCAAIISEACEKVNNALYEITMLEYELERQLKDLKEKRKALEAAQSAFGTP